MKRLSLTLLVALLWFSAGLAQNKRIDSLRQEVATTRTCDCAADSQLVKSLLLLGRQYKKISEFDSGMAAGLRALKLASAISYQKGLGDSHIIVGEIYRSQGDYEKALKHYQLA